MVSDDSRSVMFAAESFWPLCGDTWLMAGVSAPCSEDGPARGRRCQHPVGSEQPSHSRDAVARACDHGCCSDSAAGLPAHTRPSPGAGGSRESLAAPVCSQGSRAASSRLFHLWLPEFTGHLLDLQCPRSKATAGAVLSGHAAPARPVEDRWLREGWTREQEAGPFAPSVPAPHLPWASPPGPAGVMG